MTYWLLIAIMLVAIAAVLVAIGVEAGGDRPSASDSTRFAKEQETHVDV